MITRVPSTPAVAVLARFARIGSALFATFALLIAMAIPATSIASTPSQVMPRVAADGQGGSYGAWIGMSATGQVVYAQHYTASGAVALGWPAEGAIISSPAGAFDHVSIVADAAGGAFIAWDTGQLYGSVGLHHVSAAGPASVLAPILAPGSVSAQTASISALPGPRPQKFDRGDSHPVLASDGSGGVYFVWASNSELFVNTVYIRHYTAAAVPDPNWPSALVVENTYAQVLDPVVAADDSGGAYVAWTEGYPAGAMWVDRITSAGSYAPGWAIGGKRACAEATQQSAPGIVADGSGGVIAAWSDSRDPSHDHVYAQHFTADGQLGWGASGVSVCSQPSLYGPNRFGWYSGAEGRAGQIVADGAGGALLTWTDQRLGITSGLADIYAQHIAADGAPAAGWPVDGLAITNEPGDQLLSALAADGAGGAYVAWQDNRAGGDQWTLRYHRIDGAGQFPYGEPADGAVLSATPVASWQPALAPDAANGALAAWVETGDSASTVRVAPISLGASAHGALATMVSLSSDRNPAREGRTITLTASLSPAAATGAVEFLAYGRPFATAPVVAGAASATITLDRAGPRTFVAAYSGDPTFAPSSNFVVENAIARIPATVTLSSSENPSLLGRTLTLQAVVPPAASGTVEFGYEGLPSIGVAPVVDGVASLAFTLPDAGPRRMRAAYSGDTAYTAARDSLTESVYVKFPTVMSVTSTSNPSTRRDIEFVARLVPAPASGSIEFSDGDGPLATVPMIAGTAALPYVAPSFGIRDVVARFAGASEYAPAEGVLRENFQGTPTVLALQSSANQIQVEEPFVLTATIQPPAATGSVKFADSGVTLASVPVTGGQAILNWQMNAVSAGQITATYSGDTTFSSSAQALQLEVVGIPTSTSLASSANPALSGSKLRFTATVTPPVSTGNVLFSIDGTWSAPVPVTNGIAKLSMAGLADGDHAVSAYFSGGPIHQTSASALLVQRMRPMMTPVARVLAPNDGETWHVGNPATIQWDASGSAQAPRVSIYLARSEHFDWEPIALDVPNNGSYTWMVTGPGTNVGATPVLSAYVSIVDNGGRIGGDQSDLPFSIVDGTTAAVVSRLDAEPAEFGVRVAWALSRDVTFASLELQRSPAEAGPWAAIAAPFLDESGVTVAEDRTAELGATYWYRLVGTTSAGATSVFGPVQGVAGAPRTFGLSAAWPNPSRGPVVLEFTVARPTHARLDVLDLAGRERSVLADGDYAPGRYRVNWDGRDAGVALPAGVYFVRYAAQGKSYVSRVAIVK